jgi:2-haloacid dehalogenase
MDRREFLIGGTGAVQLLSAASVPATATATAAVPAWGSKPKAAVFDAFPIIDARPIALRAEQLFPGQGAKLMSTWRTRQFEYTWLRTLSGNYEDFWSVTQDALSFTVRSLGIAPDESQCQQLLNTYLQLGAWPDVRPALEKLRAAGIRLAFLSNFTSRMLDAAIGNASLQGLFEQHLTTDRVGVFKPHPRTYAMALDAFGATRDEVIFCAGAGWDAAGARYFGYRTFWLNRDAQLSEELGVTADSVGARMSELLDSLSIRQT